MSLEPFKLFFGDSFIVGRGIEVEFISPDAVVIDGKKYRLSMGQRQDLLNWLALSFGDKAKLSIPHDGCGYHE